MFGLKKCEEEDFYEFTYSNYKYDPKDIGGYMLAILLIIFIFGGIEYWYLTAIEIKNKGVLNIFIIAFIILSLFFMTISIINGCKYVYKFQKFFQIILCFYWFLSSVIIYIGPLILGIAENFNGIVKAVICAFIIGLVYLVFIFIRLLYLIRKGEMRKGCEGLYDKLISNKIAYLGFSVPIIVVASKMGRQVTIAMDKAGNRVGPLIIMLVLGFIFHIIISTLIPECIMVVYCKFRFKSFTILSTDDIKKEKLKQKQLMEERRIANRNKKRLKEKKNK